MKSPQGLLLLLMLYTFISKAAALKSHSNESTDREALLAFKENLDDGIHVLRSWNDSTHYCLWEGITCNRNRKHKDRVLAIVLPGRGLVGSISPFIGNATFLRRLNLNYNGLYGKIPPSFGHLKRLEYLLLNNNSLLGEFPSYLQNCSNLLDLDLTNNDLTGQIPSWVGFMPKLEKLHLSLNYFTGNIPSSLTNLSSLTYLFLLGNSLEGAIPYGLGQFDKTEIIQLAGNFLTGTVPDSLFNSTSLSMVSIAYNNIHGSLPASMGENLRNLGYLYFGDNRLTGAIPASLSNASQIIELYLSENNLSGRIPPELGRLCPYKLVLHTNMLETLLPADWEFATFLANCTRLQYLELQNNLLAGTIPNSLTNFTTELLDLRLDLNYLSGPIPYDIGNLVGLNKLNLAGNKLQGEVPESIGKLRNLIMLNIEVNNLTGFIPFSIGNLTQLNIFTAYDNGLEGPIPNSIENMQQLMYLDLSENALTGELTSSIFNLPSLSQVLNLSGNSLVGTIPSDIGNLNLIETISLSRNSLFGDLPNTLTKCQSLEYLEIDNNFLSGSIPTFISSLKGMRTLNLASNAFSGTIPPEIGSIKGLQNLYLSRNNLSGPIPTDLENLSMLYHLDISYNNLLEGPVPTKGVFSNITALSIQGNTKLCGGIPQLLLPVCPFSSDRKSSHDIIHRIVIITVTASLVLFLILFFSVSIMLRQRKRTNHPNSTHSLAHENYPKVSYRDLFQATDGFDSKNLIGAGRYGTVYKADLSIRKESKSLSPESCIVAVKVFNLQVLGTIKSFIAECEVLKTIRHRNLINVITCCSSIDFQGNDFKALVFDFMPNGCLHTWLHEENVSLSLIQRLNIAANIADALNYLHNDCHPSVVHCDIKPSNILLNEELTAFVGDFGLAKFISEAMSSNPSQDSQSVMIRGSIGYIAPEYGAGVPVSTQADIYSFGILLLEMFIGKKPTDDMFQGGRSLHDYARTAYPTEIMQIIDPNLLVELGGNASANNHERSLVKTSKCLSSAINVGLSCSKPSPEERMSMEDAATRIHAIREGYLIEQADH